MISTPTKKPRARCADIGIRLRHPNEAKTQWKHANDRRTEVSVWVITTNIYLNLLAGVARVQ